MTSRISPARALASLAIVGLSLGGCTKIAGDYVGKLSENSTINVLKNGRMDPSDDVEKIDTTFHIGQAGDKLTVVVRGCTIEFMKQGKDVDAVPGQTCKLSLKNYAGITAVKGTLTRDGRWLNLVVSLIPTEPGVDGGLAVLFSGTAK